MNVCTNSRIDVATDRVRSVARPCVTANEGPKNIDAKMNMTQNEGTTTHKSCERYEVNWNGTMMSVAIPGTHMYQR